MLLLLAVGCSSHPAAVAPTTTVVTNPAARAAVAHWLGDLAAHDDAAAFADLAPRSVAAVGDVDNYRRGSGRFGSVYARFAGTAAREDAVLRVTESVAVVTLRVGGQPTPSTAAVPVRLVGARWLVDPILDVGSYSLEPQDGQVVAPRPTVTAQRDDPGTLARVWFDATEAPSASGAFRPVTPLPAGWHVVTVVLTRGPDVVARTLNLRVTRA